MTDNLVCATFLTVVLLFSGFLAHIFGGGGFATSPSLILLAAAAFLLSLTFIGFRVKKLFELEFFSFLFFFQLVFHMVLPNDRASSDLRMLTSHTLAVFISFLVGKKIEKFLDIAIRIIKVVKVVFVTTELSFFTPQRPTAGFISYHPAKRLFFNYYSNLFSGLAPPVAGRK